MFCNSLGCNSHRIPWSHPVAPSPPPPPPLPTRSRKEEEEVAQATHITVEEEEELLRSRKVSSSSATAATPKPEFRVTRTNERLVSSPPSDDDDGFLLTAAEGRGRRRMQHRRPGLRERQRIVDSPLEEEEDAGEDIFPSPIRREFDLNSGIGVPDMADTVSLV